MSEWPWFSVYCDKKVTVSPKGDANISRVDLFALGICFLGLWEEVQRKKFSFNAQTVMLPFHCQDGLSEQMPG